MSPRNPSARLPAEVDSLRHTVEEALDLALPPAERPPRRLHEAMRYAVLGGGKRLRPVLCLAACRAAGGRVADALPAACALEMVHTYSLVHDDLPAMDDDDLRRGRPTVHRAYGEALAILVGDALQCAALALLAREPAQASPSRRLAVMTEILGAIGTEGMIGGQADDLEAEGRPVDHEATASIHRRKTGALIAASVRAGARAAEAPEDLVAMLGSFGETIGLAFQIIDDVLDATGSRESLGKSPGKDAKAGKATVVALLGVEGARQRADDLVEEAQAALTPLGARRQLLSEIAGYVVGRHR